jgi:hypothetical protein
MAQTSAMAYTQDQTAADNGATAKLGKTSLLFPVHNTLKKQNTVRPHTLPLI